MRRLGALILGLALVAGGPALASGGGEKKEAPSFVQLTPIALPVIVDGRLVNYVFVTLKLNVQPGTDIAEITHKEAYFRDAFVKLAHRTPFTLATDYTTLDKPRMLAAFRSAAAAVPGVKGLKSVEVVAEAPQKVVGLPRPRGGAREIQP